MKWILVTGSRDFEDRHILEDALWEEILGSEEEDCHLVVGDCPTGADELAHSFWTFWIESYLGDPVTVFQADWDTYGRGAGPIRNKEMVDFVASQEGPKVCLSFWQTGAGNRGTRNCVALALANGIPVKRFWS